MESVARKLFSTVGEGSVHPASGGKKGDPISCLEPGPSHANQLEPPAKAGTPIYRKHVVLAFFGKKNTEGRSWRLLTRLSQRSILNAQLSALLLAWTDRISSAAGEAAPRARGLPGSLSDFKRG
jgi:hypothetical protein